MSKGRYDHLEVNMKAIKFSLDFSWADEGDLELVDDLFRLARESLIKAIEDNKKLD